MTHDDDSAASQTSMAKRVAQSTKKKLGSVLKRVKKKGKSTTEKTPPSHIETDMTEETSSLVSPISSGGEEEKANVATPKAEEKEEATKPEGDARDLAVVYEDDNDGTKDDQMCGDLCVIL